MTQLTNMTSAQPKPIDSLIWFAVLTALIVYCWVTL